MIQDVQEYLQEWEKENNPFYPNEMKWNRLTVNTFLKSYKEQLSIGVVRLSLPTKSEIDKRIDDYSFRVPYDGSNNFYDEVALKHYKAGIEWMLKRIKGNEA